MKEQNVKPKKKDYLSLIASVAGIFSCCLAVFSCLAALIVVPEFRKAFNLDATPTWNTLKPLYLETFDVPDEQWEQFTNDDTWSKTAENSLYCLSNTTDIEAARYIWTSYNKKPLWFAPFIKTSVDLSESPVSVEILVQPKGDGSIYTGAGIIYRYNKENKRYYAFTIAGENFYFFRKNSNAYSVIDSGKSSLIQQDKFNKLAIIGKGNTFYLYINDNFIRRTQDDELKSGITGIIAMSTGKFCFDTFTIYDGIKEIPK